MKPIRFSLNTNLLFGPRSLFELLIFIKEKQCSQIALIIDTNVEKTSYWQEFKRELEQICRFSPYFLNEKMEPTYQYLDTIRSQFSADTDLLVGVGGGSTMDVAKAISVLVTNKKPSLTYRGFGLVKKKGIPLVLIPSTAGSGSEVTPFAVFIDEKEQRKFGINSPVYLPVLTVIDPCLTMEAPSSVTISSGMDALIHTLESYTSKKHTVISRFFSTEAFRLLSHYLPQAVTSPQDVAVRTSVSLGAYYAGVALFNSGAGIIGALSYPLGTLFRVTHGLAGAVFVQPVVALNTKKGYTGYGELVELLETQKILSGSTPAEKFLSWVTELRDEFKLPTSLTSFGMTRKDVPLFLEHLLPLQGAIDQNPIPVTMSDIEAMLYSMV